MKIKQFVAKSVLLAISSSYDRIWRDMNSGLRDEKCNALEALILISLFFEADRAVKPSMLAEMFGVTSSAVSHALTRLEKRRVLRRELSGTDARSYNLRLEPEGRKVALRLIKRFDAVENSFERTLGKDEVARTIAGIRKLEEAHVNRKALAQ